GEVRGGVHQGQGGVVGRVGGDHAHPVAVEYPELAGERHRELDPYRVQRVVAQVVLEQLVAPHNGRRHVPSPVATGRAGSLIQLLHEPTYSAASPNPASCNASTVFAAVRPDPQYAPTAPCTDANTSRSSSAVRRRPSGWETSAAGRFTAPGMWP